MKTEFTLSKPSNKDNIATATVLAISLFAVIGGLFTSLQAEATPATPVTATVAVQRLEPIVVTAPRIARTSLETIVVSVPRSTRHA